MPSPTIILIVLLAVSAAGNALLGKLYVGAKQDVARIEQEFNSFKAQQKQLGEEAQKRADQQKADDAKRKKEADDEHAKTVAALATQLERLRRNRSGPGGNILPAPAPGAASAERAAFDRAELERALRDFDAGIQGLVDEGSKAVIDLDTAKKWANP